MRFLNAREAQASRDRDALAKRDRRGRMPARRGGVGLLRSYPSPAKAPAAQPVAGPDARRGGDQYLHAHRVAGADAIRSSGPVGGRKR